MIIVVSLIRDLGDKRLARQTVLGSALAQRAPWLSGLFAGGKKNDDLLSPREIAVSTGLRAGKKYR